MNIVSSQLRRCKEKTKAGTAGRAVSPEVPAVTGVFVSSGSQVNDSKAPLVSYTSSCSCFSKWDLLDVSSRLLLDPLFNTPDEQTLIDSKKLPRTSLCNKVPLFGGENPVNVPVYKNTIHEGSAHFGGLLKCGSVWACPVCARKISEGRAAELKLAFGVWQSLGDYSQLMVSFTIPHKHFNKLDDLYFRLMKARRLLRQQKVLRKRSLKVFSEISKEYNIQGQVTGVEVTNGYHGWHPHTHDVFFVSGKVNDLLISDLQSDLTRAWLYACQRAKIDIPSIDDFIKHSVKISVALTAAEYMSKFGHEKNSRWDASTELTKSHFKVSKSESGLTPWDFLRAIAAFPEDRNIYYEFGSKFREYVRATKGRRQLFWSKGFKAFLCSQSPEFAELVEKTDQDLAEHESENKELVGTLTAEQWKAVIKYNLRGLVLETALRRPWEDVIQLIEKAVHDGTKKRE
jgi:hypothetical protein